MTTPASPDLVVGTDGLARCPWGAGIPDYANYHDTEWGRPVHGDQAIFERLTLEAFQSGLSWLTILRKRENFRAAFLGFDIERVAAMGPEDRERLMADAGIVRNRLKIDAAINNARALSNLIDSRGEGSLDELFWSAQGEPRARPDRLRDVPAHTPASIALAKELKRQGFTFIGPTTMYAGMQAMGVVDDHLRGCHA